MTRFLRDAGKFVSLYEIKRDTTALVDAIERLCADPEYPSIRWDTGKVGGGDSFVSSHRTSVMTYVDDACNSSQDFVDVFHPIHESIEVAVWDYRNKHGIDVSRSEPYAINKYGAGGEYKPHADAGHDMTRIFSMVAFLTTPEDGGDLHFPLFDIRIPAIAGTVVFFPATQPWIHAALPVMSTDKPKYSLVTWYCA